MRKLLMILALLPVWVLGQQPFLSPKYTTSRSDTLQLLKSGDKVWELHMVNDSTIRINGTSYAISGSGGGGGYWTKVGDTVIYNGIIKGQNLVLKNLQYDETTTQYLTIDNDGDVRLNSAGSGSESDPVWIGDSSIYLEKTKQLWQQNLSGDYVQRATTKKVGINTDAPLYPLDVKGVAKTDSLVIKEGIVDLGGNDAVITNYQDYGTIQDRHTISSSTEVGVFGFQNLVTTATTTNEATISTFEGSQITLSLISNGIASGLEIHDSTISPYLGGKVQLGKSTAPFDKAYLKNPTKIATVDSAFTLNRTTKELEYGKVAGGSNYFQKVSDRIMPLGATDTIHSPNGFQFEDFWGTKGWVGIHPSYTYAVFEGQYGATMRALPVGDTILGEVTTREGTVYLGSRSYTGDTAVNNQILLGTTTPTDATLFPKIDIYKIYPNNSVSLGEYVFGQTYLGMDGIDVAKSDQYAGSGYLTKLYLKSPTIQNPLDSVFWRDPTTKEIKYGKIDIPEAPDQLFRWDGSKITAGDSTVHTLKNYEGDSLKAQVAKLKPLADETPLVVQAYHDNSTPVAIFKDSTGNAPLQIVFRGTSNKLITHSGFPFYSLTTGTGNYGLWNSFKNISSGSSNLIVGNGSGQEITRGSYNCLVGSAFIYNKYAYNNVAFGTTIGSISGHLNDSIYGNTLVGGLIFTGTGHENTMFGRNIAIASFPGNVEFTGSRNLFIGQNIARERNTTATNDSNIVIGFNSFYHTDGASRNIHIGIQAGVGNSSTHYTGHDNVFIGLNTANEATTCRKNIAIGTAAGLEFVTSIGNVAIGDTAMGSTSTFPSAAVNNVAIGRAAGNSNRGTGNVFLGYKSGYAWTGNYAMFLGGRDSTASIYFDMGNNRGRWNGRMNISTMNVGLRTAEKMVVQDTLTGELKRLPIPSAGITPTDGILDWSTDKYTPYADKKSGADTTYPYFYTGFTASSLPTHRRQLALDGKLYVPQVAIRDTTIMNYSLNVENTGGGIFSSSSLGYPGVYGMSTSGVGVYGYSESSAGISGGSASGLGLSVGTFPNNATLSEVARISKGTTVAPANGIGGYISYYIQGSSGVREAARIGSIFTRITYPRESSSLVFYTKKYGTVAQKMEIDSSGRVILASIPTRVSGSSTVLTDSSGYIMKATSQWATIGSNIINTNSGNVGIGAIIDPLHKLVIGADATTKDGLNIVYTPTNKLRNTVAQATDTSSVKVAFTATGKPQIKAVNNAGATVFEVDSMGIVNHPTNPFGSFYNSAAGYSRAFTNQNQYYPFVVALTTDTANYFTADNDTVKFTYTGGSGIVTFTVDLTLGLPASNVYNVAMFDTTNNRYLGGYQRLLNLGTGYYIGASYTFTDKRAKNGNKYILRVKDESAGKATMVVQTVSIIARKER